MKRILNVKKKIGNLSKNSENPFFKSAYLDLTELLNHVEPLLWEEGLILLQPIQDNKVCSMIVDSETDEAIANSEIELPPITDPQKLGSAITYFRRYTLKSLLAIAEVDDDGNQASQRVTKKELDSKGFKYLMSEGSHRDINVALNTRSVTPEQKEQLSNKLTQLETT